MRFCVGQVHDDLQLERIAVHLADCPLCAACFWGMAAEGEQQHAFARLSGVGASKQSVVDRHDQNETALGAVDPLTAQSFDANWPPPPPLVNHPRWKVMDLLGVGGTGAVYLAEDRQAPGTFRALKILQTRLLGRQQVAARFHREVALMRAIPAHENLVLGLEGESLDTYQLLVMEYVPGLNLEELASSKPHQRLTFRHAVGLILQALAGLQHAWQTSGLVHRDLKPGNLMVTRDGTVKLLDFGLAKLQDGPDGCEITQTGITGGTPKYCSPEQNRGLRHADIRSDLYSLGCTLFRLIAGEPVFGPQTGHISDMEIRLAHHILPPRSLRTFVPVLPATLDAVVRRLLAKEPKERPATPVEVAKLLLPFAMVEDQLRACRNFPGLELPAARRLTGVNHAALPRDRGMLPVRVLIGLLVACLLSAGIVFAGVIILQVQTKAGRVEIAVEEVDPSHALPGAVGRERPLEVRIDDRPLDRTEIRVRQQGVKQWLTIDARAGEHLLRVSRPGYTVVSQKVRIEAGRTAPISVRLIPTESHRSTMSTDQARSPTTTASEVSPLALSGPSQPWDKSPPTGQTAARPSVNRLATILWGSGRWERAGDELCHYDGTGQAEQWLLFGDATWQDYDFQFAVRHEGAPTGVTALYRSPVDEQIQHFGFGWLDLQTALVEYRDGKDFFQRLAGLNGEYLKRQEEPISSDRWYTMLVKVRGERSECLVDGRTIFTVSQNRYASGRVGVRIWRMWAGKTRFRDLRVIAADGVLLWEGPPDLPGMDPCRLVIDPPLNPGPLLQAVPRSVLLK